MRTEKSGAASEDVGKLILRATLAILILLHGIWKIMNGVEPVMGLLAKAGMPPMMAYLAYVGEVVAPLLMLFGVWTRAAAAVVVIHMLFVFGLAHMSQLLDLTKSGGWALELQGMFLATAIAVALLGGGRYSVSGATGKWN